MIEFDADRLRGEQAVFFLFDVIQQGGRLELARIAAADLVAGRLRQRAPGGDRKELCRP